MSKWTEFMDMHSGGGQKLDWAYIYIEAPKDEASVVFYNRFGRNPNRVTCTCCGADYSLTESETLEQATAYNRGCDYAYFRPDGTECPKDEAWVYCVGLRPGYRGGYVERPSETRFSFNPFKPLDEYLASASVKVIRADEITADERTGTLPSEGDD